METHFQEDLNELKKHILDMGYLALSMMEKAIQAIKETNDGLTQEVFELEKKANHMHVDIDDECIKLIARQQPMAVDLRFLSAVMKINTDLERIADQTVNISQTCYYHLFKESPVKQIQYVLKLADISHNMLKNSLKALDEKDINTARQVIAQDEEEDKLKKEAVETLIELIQKDPPNSKQFVDLILLAKNMEKIGDHATNIAEDVIFMAMGKDIRHHFYKGPAQKKSVLFVCIGNSCRSQMAEGFARCLGQNIVDVWSAGSKPTGQIHPLAVKAMREKGIDISSQSSKKLDELPKQMWDYIITMGCGDNCPFVTSKIKLDWALPDPKDMPLEKFRVVRDEIEDKVKKLLSQII